MFQQEFILMLCYAIWTSTRDFRYNVAARIMAFDFLILSFFVFIITSTCLSVEVIENVFWQVSVGGDFNSLPNR